MSSDDSDDEIEKKYCEREEWKDVEPLPQNDGPDPLCPIMYKEEFVDIMNYFRAILNKDEKSARALALTADVIRVNPANYSAWHFRRLCLYALKSDLVEELEEFVNGLSRNNPKNYQMWHHRHVLAERLAEQIIGDVAHTDSIVEKMKSLNEEQATQLHTIAKREMTFCHGQILLDAKNLHAWSHRQWIVTFMGAWQDELPFIDELLTEDLRNNSAWNHRFFVVTQQTPVGNRQREIDYAIAYIRKAPNNSSPWAYLRGLLLSPKASPLDNTFNDRVVEMETLIVFVQSFCSELQSRAIACSHVISLLLDLTEWKLKQLEIPKDFDKKIFDSSFDWCHSIKTPLNAISDYQIVYQQALALCECLISQRDQLHANYWRFRKAEIMK